jgi:hypothetical protein
MADANPNPAVAPIKGRRPQQTTSQQMQGDSGAPAQMSGQTGSGQMSGGQMSQSGDRPLYTDWAMI